MNDIGMAVFEIDSIDSALRAALVAKNLLDNNHKAEAIMCVSGFDDDPRELDEIPEACEIMKAFANALGWRYFPRFEPIIVGMMLIAMGNGDAYRVDEEHIQISPAAMHKLALHLEYWT